MNKNNLIPKTIHYCWFGKGQKTDLAKKCIESWKKYCPDYKIVEWNEDNFDINSSDYVKEAYEAKKWAFVTDYVRLYAITKFGGVYMDTDVELLKNIDIFLKEDGFSGFEDEKNVPTGIMGCKKNNRTFLSFLKYYNNRHFLRDNGTYDLTTNVKTITDECVKNGLIQNNTLQKIDGITLYPNDYFCPKDHRTGKIHLTNNTYAIHHFSGSWLNKKEQRYKALNKKLCSVFGGKIGNILFSIVSAPHRLIETIKGTGIKGVAQKIGKKIRKKDK